MFLRPLIEHYSCRDCGIEGLGARMHWDGERHITCFKCFLAYARAFVPDDEGTRCIECFCSERRRAFHRKTVYPKTFFFKYFERVVHIAYRNERNAECHASRGLHYDSGYACLMMFRNKNSGQPECCCRADDGPHVMRILDFAEDGNCRVRCGIERLEEGIERHKKGSGVHDRNHTLMYGIAACQLLTLSAAKRGSWNVEFL